jgi:hypothetical protein
MVDTNTPIPNGSGNFTAVGWQALSGSTMAFRAGGANGQAGIYARSISGGAIVRIADTNTQVPGGVGNFTTFYDLPLSISGSNVVFSGTFGNNQRGFYAGTIDGGPLQKIVADGDVLDGHVVNSMSPTLTSSGLDGSTVAFRLTFTDGTSAVYTYTPVPEPTGLLPFSVAAAAGAFAAGRWLFRGF